MWTIGIDPGLTETGIVLLAPEGHYMSGITFTAPPGPPDLQRIVNLADTIVATVKSFVFDHHIRELLVAIETPILRGGNPTFNVDTYRKQINLLHEIETGLWRWHNEAAEAKVRIAEVNPTASKRVVTGSGAATKDEMVAASPFDRRDDVRRPTREALADAWAHCLAARQVVGVGRIVELEDLARERLAPKFVDTKVYRVEVKP